MFGILKSAIKATASVVDIPVSIVADVVTISGVLTNNEESYTSKAASRLVDNVADMSDPNKGSPK